MNLVRKFALSFVSDGKIARSAFISPWVKLPQLDSKAWELPLDVWSFFMEADCFNFDFDKELLAYRLVESFGINGFLLSGYLGGNIVAPDD